MVEKKLKKFNQFLNLKEVYIDMQKAYSSTSATHEVSFYFNYESEHGYVEDPKLEGIVCKIIEVKKVGRNEFVFRVKMKKEDF